MGALRRAGVWLGLVEDEDDRDRFYDDEDEDFAVPPPRTRPTSRTTSRVDEADRLESPRGGYGDRTVRESRAPQRTHDDQDEPTQRDLRIVRDRARLTDTDASGGLRRTVSSAPPTYGPSGDAFWADPRSQAPPPPEPPRPQRPPVRPVAPSGAGSTALSVPSTDGLTNAPPVHLRERAGVIDDRLTRRYEITTLHPTSYSDARAIGEQFRDGHPVIMNLTEQPEADAKRLVDFAAGLAFGLRGSIERVTNRVFLITPPNIRVSDEDKARIAEPGFFDRP
jgi:cell division inhibitor SepF